MISLVSALMMSQDMRKWIFFKFDLSAVAPIQKPQAISEFERSNGRSRLVIGTSFRSSHRFSAALCGDFRITECMLGQYVLRWRVRMEVGMEVYHTTVKIDANLC